MQGDRLGRPARPPVSVGEIIARSRVSGWSAPSTRSWSASSGPAEQDGPLCAVTQPIQEENCPPSEPEYAADQGTVGRTASGRLVQGQDLLNQIAACGPVLMPGLAMRSCQPVKQLPGRRADGYEGVPGCQLLPDHPRHQAVRAHTGAIHAEGQQRRPGQPGQRPVHHLRRQLTSLPVPLQDTLPGGFLHQVPADPGGRQHGHQLHHRRAHPGVITSPDTLQRQQHRRRHAARILTRLHRP